MADDAPADTSNVRFSLVAGGPFDALLARIGLIGADGLAGIRTAIALVLVAWLPAALLACAQATLGGRPSSWGYFTDLTVYSRLVIAVFVMVATDGYADGRLQTLGRHFRDARLIAAEDEPAFLRALHRADLLSGARWAELALVAAAIGISGWSSDFVVELSGTDWEGTLEGAAVVRSWAGEATRWVGTPLFLFLVLRWFWRFAVWTLLLREIAHLPLRLTPLHPDRSAGLGFLAIYPTTFTGFAFALSAVVSAEMSLELRLVQHGPEALTLAIAGWLASAMLLFIGPLLAFVRPLYLAREQATLDYGRLVHRLHLAFEERWIRHGAPARDVVDSGDLSGLADLNASAEMLREIRLIPVDRPAVTQMLAAIGLPLFGVIATQVPLAELLRWLAGTLI